MFLFILSSFSNLQSNGFWTKKKINNHWSIFIVRYLAIQKPKTYPLLRFKFVLRNCFLNIFSILGFYRLSKKHHPTEYVLILSFSFLVSKSVFTFGENQIIGKSLAVHLDERSTHPQLRNTNKIKWMGKRKEISKFVFPNYFPIKFF